MKTIAKAYSTAVHAENFDDIIFEGRNHKYGAFFLRTHYKNHLLTSLLTVVLIAITAAGVPHLRSILFPHVVQTPEYVPVADVPDVTYIGTMLPTPPVFEPDVFKQIANRTSTNGVIEIVEEPVNSQPLIDFPTDFPDEPFINPAVQPLSLVIPDKGEIDEPDKTYDNLDLKEPAEFKYGSFTAWVAQNIIFPGDAIDADISGKVILKFTIDEEGRVSNVVVERGLHPLVDKAAVDVLLKSPKWRPAKLNGNKVKVFYRVPLKFEVQK